MSQNTREEPETIEAEFFDEGPRPNRAQRRAERKRAAEAAARRASDPLERLREDTRAAGEAYLAKLRASDVVKTSAPVEAKREQLRGVHKIYASMMVLQCVSPLKEGANAANVLQVIGMGAAMWAMSPDFRTELGSYGDQIGAAINEKISLRSDKGAGKLVNKWKDRLSGEKSGKGPAMTAQSAALTEVGLAESAYAAMREPGADVEHISDAYESALGALYAEAAEAGLESEEVSKSMRIVVGQRIARDPGAAAVFSELAHGRFAAQLRQVKVADPQGGPPVERTAWTGDYKDSFMGQRITAGSFGLRPPMDAEEHRIRCAETMVGEMVSCRDAEELDAVLTDYAVGSTAMTYPEAAQDPGGLAGRTRTGRAASMFASMGHDGVDAVGQQYAYASAYADAVEVLQQARPDLADQWMAAHGGDWKERATARMADHVAAAQRASAPEPVFVYEEGARPAPQEQGPHGRFEAGPEGVRDVADDADGPDVVDAEVVPDQDDMGSEAGLGGEGFFLRTGGPKKGSRPDARREQEQPDTKPESKSDNKGGESLFPDGAETGRLAEAMAQTIQSDVLTDPRPEALAAWRDWGRSTSGENPWGDDTQANRRAAEMMAMSRAMANQGLSAVAQDGLAAASYVSGLERAVQRNPSYEKVVKAMVARDGGDPRKWREHEYDTALERSVTGGPGLGREEVMAAATGGARRNPEGSRAAEKLRERLADQNERMRASREKDRAARKPRETVRRAKISQHYNQEGPVAEAPLIDPDFQLGG